MTMVKEAKNALKKGTSHVMSTVRRGRNAMERSSPTYGYQPVKQASRIVDRRRTRRLPVWPLVLAVGVAALATTTAVLVHRLVTARYANDAEGFTGEDVPSGQAEEGVVTSR